MADDLFSRMWAARPWKDYATNPPSMAPQLGIALGLLHPGARGLALSRGVPNGALPPNTPLIPPPRNAVEYAMAARTPADNGLRIPLEAQRGNLFPEWNQALNGMKATELRLSPPTPANQNIRLGLIE